MQFNTPYANEILEYLKEHPNAGDSLDGILEWWLMERLLKIHKAEVHDSVRELVAMGLLEAYNTGGSTIYRLADQMRETIRKKGGADGG